MMGEIMTSFHKVNRGQLIIILMLKTRSFTMQYNIIPHSKNIHLFMLEKLLIAKFIEYWKTNEKLRCSKTYSIDCKLIPQNKYLKSDVFFISKYIVISTNITWFIIILINQLTSFIIIVLIIMYKINYCESITKFIFNISHYNTSS